MMFDKSQVIVFGIAAFVLSFIFICAATVGINRAKYEAKYHVNDSNKCQCSK